MTLGLCFCVCAWGQVKIDIWSEVSRQLSMYGNSKRHMNVSYTWGYNFTNRFSAGKNIEDDITRFKNAAEKDQ